MKPIKLNDILNLSPEDINKTKIRLMVRANDGVFDPIAIAKDERKRDKLNKENLIHNRPNAGLSFKNGNIAIGFIRLPENKDHWLMTGIVKVKKDNGRGKPADAEYYDNNEQFNFRLVVKYHKKTQGGIFTANKLMDELDVVEIWNPEKKLEDKKFPGFKNVCIGYDELKKKIEFSEEWCTALRSRKGIYLITDKSNGKLYVGSAYGEKDGILGRWRTYLESGCDRNGKENGIYPNKEFQELVERKGLSYIKRNFQYSILETFTDDVADEDIINRESHWKKVLCSKDFGYNDN